MEETERNHNQLPAAWPRWTRWVNPIAIAGLFIITGLWGARESGNHADRRFRHDLARKAIAVAAAIPVNEAKQLTFTEADRDLPAFQRISTQFKAYSRANGLRCLYTMALRDGQIYFGPEGLDPGGPLSSPVGTRYEEPSEEDFLVFKNAEPLVQGPYVDEYGPYIGASAPVIDPQTGQVLLVVGMDKDPEEWRAAVRKARMIPLLMPVLGCSIMGAAMLLMRSRLRRTGSPRRLAGVLSVEAVTCAMLMLLLTAGISLLIRQMDKAGRDEVFSTLAQLKANAYTESFIDLRNHLQLLSDTFGASDQITRDEFESYCKKAIHSYLITKSAWHPEIPEDQLSEFQNSVKSGTNAAALIDRLSTYPSEKKAYPVLYTEPETGYGPQAGDDAYADPTSRAAIDECLRSGYPTASTTIRTHDAMPPQSVVHIFQAARSKHQQGVLSLTVDLSRLTERAVTGASDLSVNLLELAPDGTPHEIFCERKDCHRNCWNNLRQGKHRIFPFFAFGKTYALMVTPEARWYRTHPLRNQQIAVIAGLLLTVMGTGLVGLLANRPMALERMIQERTADLRQSEERFEMAASAAGIGVWDLDLQTDELHWDDRMFQLYGIDPKHFDGTNETWRQCVHPDDLERAENNELMKPDIKAFKSRFRIVRPDGGIRHIKSYVKVVRNEAGTPTRLIGINLDITESRTHEERITTQLEELNRWQSVIVGREHRVIELKGEVNELLARLGQSPRYQLGNEANE